MILKRITCILCSTVFLFGLMGCFPKAQKDVINLTLWHVYGEQVDSPLNRQIEEFNATVGKEQGIRVSVTSVSNSNKIHESVLAAVHGEPGAPDLPDIFNAYPKTIMAMQDSGILVDYHDYFSEQELSDYIKEFLEEGTFDGKLTIFPIAKSTEILFVNKTLFDRFASATGAKLDDLRTWEGLFQTACAYTAWSDSLTPDIPHDGKAFFVTDYPFHYFQVGIESLGEAFFENEGLSFSKAYETAWQPLAKAALQGGVWLGEGYATEALRTGDVIASVASSASVLYYEDIVTYDDNTSENIEIISMPCPVFENGSNLVMQRGSGFCTVKSTPEREKAACAFIKWLTSPERNTEFVTSLGYVPVVYGAYDGYMEKAIEGITDPKYKRLYQTIQEINPIYHFYYPPQFDSYLELEEHFISEIRRVLNEGKDEYLSEAAHTEDKDAQLTRMIGQSYEKFCKAMGR